MIQGVGRCIAKPEKSKNIKIHLLFTTCSFAQNTNWCKIKLQNHELKYWTIKVKMKIWLVGNVPT